MSMILLKKILDLDGFYDLHLARILILISKLAGKTQTKEIKGITKLVKLDFLLRYPTVLERALGRIDEKKDGVKLQDYERNSVESKMVRFRYGPWDARYRLYLAILESKGLIDVKLNKMTIETRITSKGSDLAKKLSGINDLKHFEERSKIIKSKFDSMSATQLKDLMYELLPELHEMKYGEMIKP